VLERNNQTKEKHGLNFIQSDSYNFTQHMLMFINVFVFIIFVSMSVLIEKKTVTVPACFNFTHKYNVL